MSIPGKPGDAALHVSGLAKRYGAREVLDGIDLRIGAGEALGLAGVNGAGKTTLIKCVLDLRAPDRGTIEIFGESSRRAGARRRVAYVPEQFVPPHYLRGGEFLRTMCEIAAVPFEAARARDLLAELELDADVFERPVRQLSKGQTQKLGLAACFQLRRELYVLDEPMSGLDPASRVAVKSLMQRLGAQGSALLLTSHLLADLGEICASIAILDRGRIRFRGSPEELRAQHGESDVERAFLRCIRRDADAGAASARPPRPPAATRG